MQSKPKTEQFLILIEANRGIIYKVANSYCRNTEDRNDLIQEIIIQLWLSFAKYDNRYKLSTWMYRIALNVSISFYRKEHRRYQHNLPLPEDILYLREDAVTDDQELVNDLQRFVRELKEIDRAIMLLYLDENPYQEIADILGLSVSNISTKILRIKQQLRQKFSTLKPSSTWKTRK